MTANLATPAITRPDDGTIAGAKQPSRRPVAFAVALLLFAVLNLALATCRGIYQPDIRSFVLGSEASAPIHTRMWSWWLARKWLEQKQAPDVVLFGSSQMGSAVCASDAQHLFQVIDALTHRHASTLESNLHDRFGRAVTVFNLASPGAMCSDAYMSSKALFRKDLQPKVVILGVSPRDFIDNTMPYPAATEPFRFYSRFTTPGKLLWTSYHDPISWLQCLSDALPCHRLGAFLFERTSQANPEKFQTLHESASTPLAAILGGGEAEPGKWLVPANIPPNTWVDNTKEYKHRFQSPKPAVYQAEKQFFNAFLSNMQSRGITVLVVGMPSLPMNRALLPDKFWSEFRSTVGTACSLHNAQFLDLTDSPVFVKDDYLDTVHLNARGGAKLFDILAKYCAADSFVAARLTAPDAIESGTRTAAATHWQQH